MKIKSLILIFILVVFITFSGCENPMMYQILEPKTITFDTNGGSPVKSQKLFKNEKITEPQTPIKNEYIFEGWYTDNVTFSERWNFNNTPKGDMTLYAAWLDPKKPTPILDDFYIEGLITHIFNGYAKEVTITPKPGKSAGLITIYYNNEKTAPSEVGSYEVTFTVEETDDWNRAAIEAGTMKIAIDDIEVFYEYLKDLPPNTDNTPNTIVLNVNDLGGDPETLASIVYALNSAEKFINLDLSGSTFSSNKIPAEAFEECHTLTGITIPNSVTSIGFCAFNNCTSLTSVTIPDSVTSIGNSAFGGCTSLTSVTIPDSVTSIENSAFGGCTSLTAINVGSSNTEYSSDNGVLYNKGKTTLLAYPAGKKDVSYTIPNSVTIIGGSAFMDCTGLTIVTIPNSVTSIENYAFIRCTSLTSITIPDSVTSIGVGAFQSCESLTSVTISKSVTSIGNNAFYGCNSLTSVTFEGANVTLGNAAFPGDLATVYKPSGNNDGTLGTYTRPSGTSTTWTLEL
jgi:uncharacterized repeat protein (TIGR02543 family)